MLFIEKILKEKDSQQRTKNIISNNQSVLINKKTNIQILEDVIIDFFKRNDLKIIVEKASVKIKSFSQEERLFEKVEEIKKLKKDIKNLIRFFIKQEPEMATANEELDQKFSSLFKTFEIKKPPRKEWVRIINNIFNEKINNISSISQKDKNKFKTILGNGKEDELILLIERYNLIEINDILESWLIKNQ